MMYKDEKIYRVRQVVRIDDDGYRQHARQSVRAKAGAELLDVLEQQRLPAVVDFSEIVESFYEYGQRFEVFQVDISITPVVYKHVEMVSHVPMELIAFRPTFIDKIKRWWNKLATVGEE